MKLYISVILTALILSFTACRSESEPVAPRDSDDGISLSFRMSTGVASRADDLHDETDSEYPWFEDRIDPRDLAVFVFVKKAGSSDDEQLLLNTVAPHDSIDFYIDGSPGEYIVNMTVSRAFFAEILGSEVGPNSRDKLTFRIAIFANCTPQTPSTPWSALTATTFPDLIAELKTDLAPFSVSNFHSGTEAIDPNDSPAITEIYNGSPIPMFGTNTFTVSQLQLYESRPDERLHLGSVSMLRAVAKIRVVDNIENKDADGYPKIIGAEISSTQNLVKQLPYNAATYQDGTQVHTPDIAEPSNIQIKETAILGLLPDNWTMTPANERKGSTFAAFIPEQAIGTYINNDVNQPALVYNIYVEMRHPIDGSKLIRTYTKNMIDFRVTFGEQLLRNHIYTLSVNEIEENSIKCEVDLVPYRGCVLDPWFGLPDPEDTEDPKPSNP